MRDGAPPGIASERRIAPSPIGRRRMLFGCAAVLVLAIGGFGAFKVAMHLSEPEVLITEDTIDQLQTIMPAAGGTGADPGAPDGAE